MIPGEEVHKTDLLYTDSTELWIQQNSFCALHSTACRELKVSQPGLLNHLQFFFSQVHGVQLSLQTWQNQMSIIYKHSGSIINASHSS